MVKKMLPCALVILMFVALAIGCGGGGDKDEKTPETSVPPTTPAQTTPAPSPTEAATPTVEPTTPTPEPSPTPEPTAQPSPTPTVNPDSVEVVLAPVMDNLVVAFAEVNGQWEGYAGPKALPLTVLQQNQVYMWYATEQVSLGGLTLYKGWNPLMWLSSSAPIESALAGYEGSIPFVILTDIQAGKNYLYQSSAVKDLTVIPVGQTYTTFIAAPGELPQWPTKTR